MGVGPGCMSNCVSNRDQKFTPRSSTPVEAMVGPCMKEAADNCDVPFHDPFNKSNPYYDCRTHADDGQVMPYIAPPDFRADEPEILRRRRNMLGVNAYNSVASSNDAKDADVRRSYDIDSKPLGNGSYGLCHKAVSKGSKEARALKYILKTDPQIIAWGHEEVKILKYLHHPNIIRFYETFEDTNAIYIITELCEGGCLVDRLKSGSSITEYQSMVLMEQVFRAVQYIHSMEICHRDLKPENFLLLLASEVPFPKGTPLEENTLKMIDFGMSCVFAPGELMRRRVGTPCYVAPEVWKNGYTEACDLWSCGVMLYLLLSGKLPFNGKTDEEIRRSVEHGNYGLNGSTWRKVSEDAKGLLRGCLTYDPKDRFTATQALNHIAITGK